MGDKIIVIGPTKYCEPFEKLGDVTRAITDLVYKTSAVKLVVFTGGEDIHPSLYNGMDVWGLCYTNLKRDIFEEKVFKYCLKNKIKMTGICRGLQLLNVMAGGRMYHHIEHHALWGMHMTYFPYTKDRMAVTSTHHQLVDLPKEAKMIAWSSPKRSLVSRKGVLEPLYVAFNGETGKVPKYEVEAAVFPGINSMGVQYHPEVMRNTYKAKKHYKRMIKHFMESDISDFAKAYGRRPKNAKERERPPAGGKDIRRAAGA